MKPVSRFTFAVLTAAVVAAVPALALADEIQLKDGRTLSGSMVRRGNEMIIRTTSGETVTTTPDQVMRVTLTSNLTPAQAAEAEWNRAAAAIKKADDLATVVSLHQKFLEKYPSQPMSETVKTSLGEYQKLEQQKAVKFRGRWMPAAQVEVTIRDWQEKARPAMDLYRSGKVREAFDAARQIALTDDDNPFALAIAGLSAFRISNLSAARQHFTKLAAADPSSPLAENNLAVIATQQKNYAESLVHYTRAVQIAPGNRLVLDNIQEALAIYHASGGDKSNTVYRNLMRPFEQAEARMQAQMAAKNLYRYGSTWVPREQLSRYTTTRESIQAAMTQLDGNYKVARQTFATLKDQIARANDDYNTTLNSINLLNMQINGGQYAGGDITSQAVRRERLMQDLEEIRARKVSMEEQRDQIAIAFTDMQTQAAKLKAAWNGAEGTQFSGLQRMMEIGEDVEPPPPAPVPAPKMLAVAPQAERPPAVRAYDNSHERVVDTLSSVIGPIGYPGYPGIPQRPTGWPGGHSGGHGGGHGGHGGHGGGHDGHGGGLGEDTAVREFPAIVRRCPMDTILQPPAHDRPQPVRGRRRRIRTRRRPSPAQGRSLFLCPSEIPPCRYRRAGPMARGTLRRARSPLNPALPATIPRCPFRRAVGRGPMRQACALHSPKRLRRRPPPPGRRSRTER